jgi:hypothetical protein
MTPRYSKEQWVEKAKSIHGEKYDYSKVEYINTSTKICIICPKHGEFSQTPKDHLRGRGCGKCGGENSIKKRTKTTEKFIQEVKEKHGDCYDLTKVDYINDSTKVCIICKKHGDFYITPLHLLSGEGCRLCGIEKAAISRTKKHTKFLEECVNSHQDGTNYDYSKSNYISDKVPVRIICHVTDENGNEHGEFWQSPNNHISKSQGCPKCGRLKSDENRKYTQDEWIEKAKLVHKNKYDYTYVKYINSDEKVAINCLEHGTFYQKPSNHLMKQGCPKCFKDKSGVEREITEYISSLGIEFIENERKILNGKEIDIYIPSKKIGIEVNGLIWHSDLYGTDYKYHLQKTNDLEKQGIKLIHVFEDEWNDKRDIVKSRLSNILGVTKNKLYARTCEIKEVSSEIASTFLNKNHIQGNVGSTVKIGLFYDKKLVSLMTFGKERKALGGKNKDGCFEMIRFCNKLNFNVIGGASRLLKYFIRTYNPKQLISYADRRWSQGRLYETLGFEFIKNTTPNYFYVVKKRRENRFKYRKDILVKEGFDPNKSEREIMAERKIPRIYDCGCKLYKLTFNNI